jgi:hypothetical protein
MEADLGSDPHLSLAVRVVVADDSPCGRCWNRTWCCIYRLACLDFLMYQRGSRMSDSALMRWARERGDFSLYMQSRDLFLRQARRDIFEMTLEDD